MTLNNDNTLWEGTHRIDRGEGYKTYKTRVVKGLEGYSEICVLIEDDGIVDAYGKRKIWRALKYEELFLRDYSFEKALIELANKNKDLQEKLKRPTAGSPKLVWELCHKASKKLTKDDPPQYVYLPSNAKKVKYRILTKKSEPISHYSSSSELKKAKNLTIIKQNFGNIETKSVIIDHSLFEEVENENFVMEVIVGRPKCYI